MSLFTRGHLALALLILATVPACGGGGGGGGSSPEAQTAAALQTLDREVLAGTVTEAEFATRLQALLAAVDGRTDGAATLSVYYRDQVVGGELLPATARASATAAETIDAILASESYQMLEAFVSSVASNLLVADPANMLLEVAKPEVFLSTAAVVIRARIYEAMVDGQITPETAQELYELGRKNPWEAQRALAVALSQTPPDWVVTVAAPCLRSCAPTGDTAIYAGPFSKVFSASGGGCTWQERLSGTIEVVVTGRGTVADPFDGTMDVTGSLVETLTSGVECDPGGTYTITSFDGAAFGNDGKLYGEGDGIMGAGSFYAALGPATVTSSAVTGGFELQIGTETLQMTVALTAE